MTRAVPGFEPVSLDALPSMPAAAVRIVDLCDRPNVELGELAEAVELDPALSARILRLANSAAYNRGQEVTTIDRAMMLMGIKLVKVTALGFVVGSTLSTHLDNNAEVSRRVWRQCLVRAVACRELAHRAHLRNAPEAFLAGLFDGMGQLLGMLVGATSYAPLLAQDPFPTHEAERACLGMTAPELVSAALRSWGVPELYPRVIDECEASEPRYDDSEVGKLAAVLTIARDATRRLLGDGGAPHPRVADCGYVLQLADDTIDSIAVDLGVHVTQLAATLEIDLGTDVDFHALLMEARSQMVRTTTEIAEESLRHRARVTSLEDQRDQLRHASLTDRLTGLPNRAAFEDALAAAVDDRVTGRTLTGGLGVAMIDIDHFKQLNDTYGHRMGDRVLAAVGTALAEATRGDEFIARYGGEEFVLVMPIVESASALQTVVDRIRRLLAELEIDGDGLLLGVTVSIGAVAASSIVSDEAAASLTEAADRLLYQAKHGGRNATRIDFLGR